MSILNPTSKNMESTKVYRFDDVCLNADLTLIANITNFISNRVPDCKIIYGISPLMHTGCGQRVYPEIFNALSNHKVFYRPDKLGLPIDLHKNAEIASHGLIHVDHRLLSHDAQEMSILVSCSLVGANRFIPPFNKYNADTEKICAENNIELFRFEDGWKSMEHNKYDDVTDLWYLHARAWDMYKIADWFNGKG